MFSLVSFLKIDTFSEYYFWNQYINKALSPIEGFEVLHQVIQPILLRRTKASTYTGGAVILELPKKHIETVMIDFLPEEKKVYDLMLENSKSEYNSLVRKGTVLKQYTHVFSLLTRLRQLSDHARIVFREQELTSELGIQKAVDRLFKKAVGKCIYSSMYLLSGLALYSLVF